MTRTMQTQWRQTNNNQCRNCAANAERASNSTTAHLKLTALSRGERTSETRFTIMEFLQPAGKDDHVEFRST